MDRRTFLSRSALALGTPALAASTLAGCGGATVRPSLSALETEELLTRLERGLTTVRTAPLSAASRATVGAAPWQVRGEVSAGLLRMTLASLVISDVARSVPEGVPMPRALEERLAPLLPVLAHAAATHHALLSRMPPAVRRNLDRRVRERPELAMNVASWIDAHASELGVATESRVRLRTAASNVATRMRRQSSDAVIDECLAKVERAVVRHGGSSSPAPDAARMVDALWEQVGESDALASPLPPPPSVPSGTPPDATQSAPLPSRAPGPLDTTVPATFGVGWDMDNPTTPVQWSEHWARPGDEEIRIASIVGPLGAISCGLLLIVGLIVLIAGHVQNGDWDGRTTASDP